MRKNAIAARKGLIRTAGCTLLLLCFLWTAVAHARADKPWYLTAEAEYVSQYMWRGFDILRGDGAIQPSIDLSLYGLGAKVWASFALESEDDDLNEWDFTGYWGRTFFKETPCALGVRVHYAFYHFPNTDSERGDFQEVALTLEAPNLLPIGPVNVVPWYFVAYDWKVHSEGPDDGVFHILGVRVDYASPVYIPGTSSLEFSAYGDITYNDGAFDVNPGWTHSTVGLSATLGIGRLYVSPSVNYQFSYEDQVDTENEFWTTVRLGVTF